MKIPSTNPTEPWLIAETIQQFKSGKPIDDQALRSTLLAVLERLEQTEQEVFEKSEKVDRLESEVNKLRALVLGMATMLQLPALMQEAAASQPYYQAEILADPETGTAKVVSFTRRNG